MRWIFFFQKKPIVSLIKYHDWTLLGHDFYTTVSNSLNSLIFPQLSSNFSQNIFFKFFHISFYFGLLLFEPLLLFICWFLLLFSVKSQAVFLDFVWRNWKFASFIVLHSKIFCISKANFSNNSENQFEHEKRQQENIMHRRLILNFVNLPWSN